MNWLTQFMIAYEMFKDWLKETFGSGTGKSFPTAPGYVEGYAK